MKIRIVTALHRPSHSLWHCKPEPATEGHTTIITLTCGSLSVVVLSCLLLPGLCGALGNTGYLILPPRDDDPPLVE